MIQWTIKLFEKSLFYAITCTSWSPSPAKLYKIIQYYKYRHSFFQVSKLILIISYNFNWPNYIFFLELISLFWKINVLILTFEMFSVFSKTMCQETMELFVLSQHILDYLSKNFFPLLYFWDYILCWNTTWLQIVRYGNIHIHKNMNYRYGNILCTNLTGNRTSFVIQIHRTLVK